MANLFSKIQEVREWDTQTKIFYLNWFVYGLILLLTTFYCYARLDHVRSGHPETESTHNES